jgi:3-oxoacyl-[acyl-carrier protein] reductase
LTERAWPRDRAELSGRVAIVTGAARGIGRAVAGALGHAGASVVVVDADGAAADLACARLAAEGVAVLACPGDVSRDDQVRTVVDRTLERFGRVDVLVNNAGIIRRGSIDTVTEDDWRRVLDVNATGPFLLCRAVVPVMRRQGAGTIVNVSSIAAKLGDLTSAPGYGPSKAALDALTKTLARQLAASGIRVNGVAPHAIETDMSAQWSAERRREIVAGIPLGRLGSPADVAQAVLFLASDRAGFITGEILDVNGGALMD